MLLLKFGEGVFQALPNLILQFKIFNTTGHILCIYFFCFSLGFVCECVLWSFFLFALFFICLNFLFSDIKYFPNTKISYPGWLLVLFWFFGIYVCWLCMYVSVCCVLFDLFLHRFIQNNWSFRNTIHNIHDIFRFGIVKNVMGLLFKHNTG